eukprot:jgi/Botrbrau1/2575/Bobra.145_1s0003.1
MCVGVFWVGLTTVLNHERSAYCGHLSGCGCPKQQMRFLKEFHEDWRVHRAPW